MRVRFQYSLLSLSGLAVVCAIVLAFATSKRNPKLDEFHIFNGSEFRIFQVKDPVYQVHKEGNTHFLTVRCSTQLQVSLTAGQKKPSIEFSIPFDTDPTTRLVKRTKLSIPVYNDQHGNLTNLHYWRHGDIEYGVMTINESDGTSIDATISVNGGELMLRAKFNQSENLSRSFN